MKKLMLATVSSLALGLAGFGVGYAQTPASTDTNTPSATTPATPSTQAPVSPMDQGSQANQATPGTTNGTGDTGNSSYQANENNPNAMGTQSTMGTQDTMGNQSASGSSSRGELRQAQQQLRAAGLYKGRVDGRMGPATRRAVMAFQQQHNLNATGTLDQQTLSALQNGGQNSRG